MSRGSRKLAALFLAVVVPAAITLVWLGLQLLQQDRSLSAQREVERRQAAAQTAVHSLEQSLAEFERNASGAAIPEAAVRFTISPSGIQAQPARRILWLRVTEAPQSVDALAFAEPESLEFQGGAARALARYEELAHSAKAGVRAAALLRIARVHRQQGDWDGALTAYRDLAQMKGVAINSTPVDLLARRAYCSVLEETGRKQELAREAATLETDFLSGRWKLDQAAWELAGAEIAHWTGHPLPVSEESKTFSAAAAWLWSESQRNQGQQQPPFRSRVVILNGAAITFLERTTGSGTTVLALLPSILPAWIQKALAADPATGGHISLVDESGQVLVGPPPDSGPATVKHAAAETGLPWAVVFSPGDSSHLTEDFARRRRLLSWGLAAIVLLLAGGSYLLWRVIQQELVVARLQTDFVAAVSHEFRTPLTSLRHFTELLEEDDDLPREQRQSFYQALGRNTERLHRLVESLLDFARMEGGRKPYNLQPVDASALAAQVVGAFRAEAEPRGFTIQFDTSDPGELVVNADAESITHALWNLLDNAVKYSPEARRVVVSVRGHPHGVELAVQDCGLGIPRHEHAEIFRRFVRGEQARKLGIKGTGLGLAMVSHIVNAHGGAIELESQEGAGSTFRMVLPARG